MSERAWSCAAQSDYAETSNDDTESNRERGGLTGPRVPTMENPHQGRVGAGRSAGLPIPAQGGQAPTPALGAADAANALRRYRRAAILTDLAAAVVAVVGAVALRFGGAPSPLYAAVTVALPVLWIAALVAQRGYDLDLLGVGPDEYVRVLRAGLVLFAITAAASFGAEAHLSRSYLLVAIPPTVLGAALSRAALRHRLHRMRRAGRGLRRSIVAGDPEAAAELIGLLATRDHGLDVVGACVTPRPTRPTDLLGVPVVAEVKDVLAAVVQSRADAVLLACAPELTGMTLTRLSSALAERGAELMVLPGIVEPVGPRLSIRPRAGMALVAPDRPGRWRPAARRELSWEESLGTAVRHVDRRSLACDLTLITRGIAPGR